MYSVIVNITIILVTRLCVNYVYSMALSDYNLYSGIVVLVNLLCHSICVCISGDCHCQFSIACV